MVFRTALIVMVVFTMVCGCGRSERAELKRTRAELEKSRAEVAELNAQLAKVDEKPDARGYLEELEKLDSLKTKGVLTQDEFDRRKRAILESQKLSTQAEQPAQGMDKLARELRDLKMLLNKSAITMQEHSAKKNQLIQRPLQVVDLKKDLETVQALTGESAITMQEQTLLKQKLLELDNDRH